MISLSSSKQTIWLYGGDENYEFMFLQWKFVHFLNLFQYWDYCRIDSIKRLYVLENTPCSVLHLSLESDFCGTFAIATIDKFTFRFLSRLHSFIKEDSNAI